jgi:hypothetical protein
MSGNAQQRIIEALIAALPRIGKLKKNDPIETSLFFLASFRD